MIISFVLGFYVKGKSTMQSIAGMLTLSALFLISGVIIQFVKEDLKRFNAEVLNLKTSLKQSEIQKAIVKSMKLSAEDLTK